MDEQQRTNLEELARQQGATIVSLPSVPQAMATLESFSDVELPGITDLPATASYALTPDIWAAAARLSATRIEALAEASIKVWQLIAVAVQAGSAPAVEDLRALLRRRTTAVRLSELGRAVDRIAASMSPHDLGGFVPEGELVLARTAATHPTIPVPADADPALTALGNRIEARAGELFSQIAAAAPSPLVAYLTAYRSITPQHIKAMEVAPESQKKRHWWSR